MTVWTILEACGAMAVIDVLAAMRTIAESRGEGWKAGFLDANGGLAGFAFTALSVGSVVKYGWSVGVFAMMAALYATDLVACRVGVALGGCPEGNRR